MVAKDSWARIVDLFVDILPLDELGFIDVLAKRRKDHLFIAQIF